jgi:hypothetical protein
VVAKRRRRRGRATAGEGGARREERDCSEGGWESVQTRGVGAYRRWDWLGTWRQLVEALFLGVRCDAAGISLQAQAGAEWKLSSSMVRKLGSWDKRRDERMDDGTTVCREVPGWKIPIKRDRFGVRWAQRKKTVPGRDNVGLGWDCPVLLLTVFWFWPGWVWCVSLLRRDDPRDRTMASIRGAVQCRRAVVKATGRREGGEHRDSVGSRGGAGHSTGVVSVRD